MDRKTKQEIANVEKSKSTARLQCSCQHSFQDTLYGKGIRLHNLTKAGKARCTVCGKEK